MTTWLKQSTAAEVSLGPFVDATDGVTAETALTISQADIRLKKNDGAFAQTNNAAGATHQENGYYEVPLDTTDTNTLGRLRVAVAESGALPVWADYMVVPANVWDSLFGADFLQVDIAQILGTTSAGTAGKVGIDLAAVTTYAAGAFHPTGVVDSGTAQSATGTTLVLRAAAGFADSELVGATVVIRSATAGAGQRRVITANVNATDTVTVDTWTTTPTGTIVYDIFGSPPASTTAPSAVNLTQILGTAVSTPATAGILDVNVKNIDNDAASASGTVTFPNATLASTTNITAGTITTVTNLTNAPTSGDLTATMKTSVTTACTASTPVAASVTGAVGSVTATVNADVKKVNGVTITGVGTDADQFDVV